MVFEKISNRLLQPKLRPLRARVRRLAKLIDALLITAIYSEAADTVESTISQLADSELSIVTPATIFGAARLFIDVGFLQSAEDLISRYLESRQRPHLMIYFWEPLSELDAMGALTKVELKDFCAHFRSGSSAHIIDWLGDEYSPADEVDARNFHRFILSPLRGLSAQAGNLMDIRLSKEQRTALREMIVECLSERRPLSLLRLGDGEAFAYPPPEVEGIPSKLFESDDQNFQRAYFPSGKSLVVSCERLITDFRRAVANCDVLGTPSVFRIIRNLTEPRTRYGMRRNQRAFLRVLSALGGSIPLERKIFTEERCHRVRGAIDEVFVLALASQAESIVLVSRWPELQRKFPKRASLILVPPKKRSLYQCYPEIADRVCSISKPGTLVLVGAGVPAKIIAERAKQSGAVALDIGSLMDYMVGHNTRTISDYIARRIRDNDWIS